MHVHMCLWTMIMTQMKSEWTRNPKNDQFLKKKMKSELSKKYHICIQIPSFYTILHNSLLFNMETSATTLLIRAINWTPLVSIMRNLSQTIVS